jgi:hypothetical protein
MSKTALVITSIAGDSHPVLQQYAEQCAPREIEFIVVGDTKSPTEFNLPGCNFFSVNRQKSLDFSLASLLPYKHYARKNLGYLVAIKAGADVIVETDDDNIPLAEFWSPREKLQSARIAHKTAWTNVYGYFSQTPIWPRGFALDKILDPLPRLSDLQNVTCPVQQGLADDNPDVDAIYRLTQPLPIQFDRADNVGLQAHAICPFNSQNTTWFAEAFPLLYLPSYCSFRMTDIWRSFVTQRIMWSCDWTLLFHNSTVRQERNDHSLMADFEDEISGYTNNHKIVDVLTRLELKSGSAHLSDNLYACYESLVANGYIDKQELPLLSAWIKDINLLLKHT